MKAEDSAEATGSGLAVMTGPPDADAEVAVKEVAGREAAPSGSAESVKKEPSDAAPVNDEEVTGQGAAPPELEIAGQSAPVTQKQ